MCKNIIRILLIHIIICSVCMIILKLTWLGPEGGILLQHNSQLISMIVFGITLVIQMLVICIYFYMGIKLCSFSVSSVMGIINISIINISIIFILVLLGNDIGSAVKLFSLFGNTPFFVISMLNGYNFVTNIIFIFLPTVILFVGDVCGCLYVKMRKSQLD